MYMRMENTPKSSSVPESPLSISRSRMMTRTLHAASGMWLIYSGAEKVQAVGKTGADNPQIPTKGFQTKSGLKYFDVREGDGESPRYGQVISFLFASYYKANPDVGLEKIDESGSQPFLHKHGNGRVVRGVDEALHTMKVGGQRRVIIPKDLGYTELGLGPFPSDPGRRNRLGAIIDDLDKDRGQLIFDLQLLYVGDDDNDQGYYDDIGVSQDEIRELALKAMKSRGKGSDDMSRFDPASTTGAKDAFKGM